MPHVHLLMPQGQHLLHGGDPGAGEALAVLAHPDGLQPLGHRPEHGAVAAAGAGQADGDSEEQRSSLVSGFPVHGRGKAPDRLLSSAFSLRTAGIFVPWVKVGDGF